MLQIDHDLIKEITQIESATRYVKPYPEAGVYESLIPQECAPIDVVSRTSDTQLQAEYDVFQDVLRDTPIQKIRRKAREAMELERHGNATAARELWTQVLALAKLWKATSGEEYFLTSPLLVTCSHFHLARAYWTQDYVRQAVSHASR